MNWKDWYFGLSLHGGWDCDDSGRLEMASDVLASGDTKRIERVCRRGVLSAARRDRERLLELEKRIDKETERRVGWVALMFIAWLVLAVYVLVV